MITKPGEYPVTSDLSNWIIAQDMKELFEILQIVIWDFSGTLNITAISYQLRFDMSRPCVQVAMTVFVSGAYSCSVTKWRHCRHGY